MPRLRHVDCSGPGITRRRRGRGFEYRDEAGNRIGGGEVLGRISELAIPPAGPDLRYAAENESYGLATIHKRHVRLLDDSVLVFDYPAKGGQRRIQSIVDPEVFDIVAQLKRRRGGASELLAYRDGRRWRDLRSDDINA